MLVLLLLADGDDPLELIDEVGESEDSSKGDDGAKKAKQKNVLKVALKVFLLEIVSACEDHGGEEAIEKYLFVEVDVRDVFGEVDQQSKEQSDDDADSGLVDHVDLVGLGGTFRCSRYFPMRMYRIIRIKIPIRIKENSYRSISIDIL